MAAACVRDPDQTCSFLACTPQMTRQLVQARARMCVCVRVRVRNGRALCPRRTHAVGVFALV